MQKAPKVDFSQKIRNILFFRKRQVDLKEKVRAGYIQNGVGIIPCRVDHYRDIVNEYSVKGYEALNPCFAEYVRETIYFIPPEYPVVIKIVGGDFSEHQKEVICATIKDDFLYELGETQIENRRQWLVALLTGVGVIVLGAVLAQLSGFSTMPIEFIYIIFWFFADIFVSYIFFDGFENRKKRILAGRLASVGVSFAKNNKEGGTVTKREAAKVYKEIFEEDEE